MPDRSGMTMRVCIVNSFAGIHFETANGQHHSIRANGVVTVSERMWLVRPLGSSYAPQNPALQGICPVSNKPRRFRSVSRKPTVNFV